ncbi:MAG: hypothetical protein ACI9JE_001154 [Candidatus Krumholzibacteriia bacterium]
MCGLLYCITVEIVTVFVDGEGVVGMMRRLLVLLFGCGVFLLAAGSSLADESDAVHVVPTEMCRGYFFIPVTLAPKEGAPEDRTLWFLFDTGAGSTHVDGESLERVTGKKFKRGQRVTIKKAKAGPANIVKMSVKVADLDHLSHALGREIDGILGFDTFQDFLLTLDYETSEIRIQKGNLPKPDQQTIFDASGPDDRPWLEVQFSNRKRRMLIDSGAALAGFVVKDLEKFERELEPRPTGVAFGFNNREYRYSARATGSAHIGRFELTQPILQSTRGTELIGGKILHHFILTFDQDKERVKLVQIDGSSPVTFKPLMGHGIVINSSAEGFEVVGSLEDTPASHSTLEKGDLITHWNGVPVNTRGCGEHIENQDVLVLGVMRADQVLEIELNLFPLVK